MHDDDVLHTLTLLFYRVHTDKAKGRFGFALKECLYTITVTKWFNSFYGVVQREGL